MATRSERFHATEERSHARANRDNDKKRLEGRTKPGVPSEKRSRDKKHAEKKATYALELANGRPSRKSTRKSANRAMPAARFDVREELVRGKPEARQAKARARTVRPRGSSKGA